MIKKITLVFLLSGISSAILLAQEKGDPKTTEVYSPVPKVVTPGNSPEAAPSDAIVLFDGSNLDQWTSVKTPGAPANWTVADGMLTINKFAGNIQTKKSFTDYQLHLEWRIPANISGTGQGRGNSGVFLASTGPDDDGYEIQILDCYNNSTYVNGQTGSVYKQSVPMANACKKPGEWQTYDIIWNAPRFKTDGSVKTPAYVTVIQNGVLLQNHTELTGQTLFIGTPFYKQHGPEPIKLQAHGDPLSYRNIWVREL
ncbi:MAG: DUF1080 domain-containing protein [Bacteroidota bacterium]